MAPLAALRLVTGYGIGILDLQSVEVGVGAQLLHALALVSYLGVIGPHGLEECLLLLPRECRRLAHERVQQHCHLHLAVGVVGKDQCGIGEAESVEAPLVVHTAHYGSISIGYEDHLLLLGGSTRSLFLGPEIVVLRHQHLVATAQFLLHI